MTKRPSGFLSQTRRNVTTDESTPESTDDQNRGVSRRTVLQGLAGSAALSAGVFGWSGTSRAASGGVPDRLANTFGDVKNVVEAGADPTGTKSINGVLEDLRADDTLLYFPPGKYYMDEQFRFTGFERLGLYGDDATLVPANYYDNADGKHKLFRLGTHYAPGDTIVVENFSVDFTAPDTGVRAFECVANDDLQVRDVTVDGRHDSGMWGPGRFVVRDPNGSGVVERFAARDGGEWSENTPSAGDLWRGPSGIICNTFNEGEVTFEDCELGGFPDNGLYAGGSKGRVVVDGGHYANSNGNNVRVGGPDALVTGVTVTVDETSPEASAHRGIRLQGTDGATVEHTNVHIGVPVEGSTGIVVMDGCTGQTDIMHSSVTMDGDEFNHAITVSPDASRVRIYDCDIEQQTDGGCAVKLDGTGADDEWAMLAQVRITGSPTNKWNRAAIYNERDNVEFRAVTVDQTGGSKRRAIENFGDDCIVYKCDLRTNQYPVIDTASDTWASYNTFASHGDFEGYFLTDSSSNVYLKRNVIENGVRDDGCAGLKMVGNDLS